ncbi:MAG: hypothetical protein KBD78_09325 [Oligoflexales bacterium]|nr:hypothetical protein [Oligoflexales bacterium]
MKQIIFFEILNRLVANPQQRKKIKIVAFVAIFGFFIATGLVIWGGISALRFAGSQLQAVDVQNQVEKIDSKLRALPEVTMETCWIEAQNLLNLDIWLTRPFADNLKDLKVACLDSKQTV